MARLRVGVLISGRGSNLQALIDAAADPGYPAEIVLVISNRLEAAGLQHGVELVALAGFMRLLDAGFVEGWHDRMINIHPSLLPAFPGLHPQRQALAAGVRFSGCTVHFVRVEVDTGPIISQAVLPVRDDDDEERLSARILAAEHRLYPLALRLYAEGRLKVAGNRVTVAGGVTPEIAVLNPSEALASGRG
jgi:phosphoribosylglycinamide formyltransferase-1